MDLRVSSGGTLRKFRPRTQIVAQDVEANLASIGEHGASTRCSRSALPSAKFRSFGACEPGDARFEEADAGMDAHDGSVERRSSKGVPKSKSPGER